MYELRLSDAKSLGGNLIHWINEAEDLSRFGYGIGEIATRIGATCAAVKYLINYYKE